MKKKKSKLSLKRKSNLSNRIGCLIILLSKKLHVLCKNPTLFMHAILIELAFK